MSKKTSVFISGTSSDFRKVRKELDADLRGDFFDINVQEHFRGSGGSLLEKLNELILQSQVVIGLIGKSVGELSSMSECQKILDTYPKLKEMGDLGDRIERGEYPSYTQWEIYLAIFHGIDCLLYIDKSLDSTARPEKIRLNQWNFYRHVRQIGKDFRWFNNPDEIYRAVQRDSRPYIQRQANAVGIYKFMLAILMMLIIAIPVVFYLLNSNSQPIKEFPHPRVGQPMEPGIEDIPVIRNRIPDTDVVIDFVMVPADRFDSELAPFWISCGACEGAIAKSIQFKAGDIADGMWLGNVRDAKRLRDEISEYTPLGTPRFPTRRELRVAKQFLLSDIEKHNGKFSDQIVLSWTTDKTESPNWSVDLDNTHTAESVSDEADENLKAKAHFVIPASKANLSFFNKTDQNVFLAVIDSSHATLFKKNFQIGETHVSFPKYVGWYSVHLTAIPSQGDAESIGQIYLTQSETNFWNLTVKNDRLTLEPIDPNMAGLFREKVNNE